MKYFFYILCIAFVFGCQNSPEGKTKIEADQLDYSVKHAQGFSIEVYKDFAIIEVEKPWPNSKQNYRYLVQYTSTHEQIKGNFDAVISVPISSYILSSTTHIPSAESLGILDNLVGFPNTDYISSKSARKRIKDGKITDVGQNQQLNTELILNLNPDVFVGFSVDGANKAYSVFEKAGIPIVYNGDWVESTPLGKAEWIKFFGALFNKNKLAQQQFEAIENAYHKTKQLAKTAKNKPKVISGSLYNDKWYLPNGTSWQAQFIKDANANYMYKNTSGSGSLALAFESVLNKASEADIWISPGSYTSYETMLNDQPHYKKFKAFSTKKVYSVAQQKGETGGVLFYELAPNRPDLVLKDLVKVFHPELLPHHNFHFFSPLQ